MGRALGPHLSVIVVHPDIHSLLPLQAILQSSDCDSEKSQSGPNDAKHDGYCASAWTLLELFEPAMTGSTLTHGLIQRRICGDEVDMTSKVINLRWEQRLVVSDSESIRR